MGKAIGTPRSRGVNVCAFCKYWGGDPQLERYKINDVLYNDDGRGECLSRGSTYRGGAISCPKFEMSYEAQRFCKL